MGHLVHHLYRVTSSFMEIKNILESVEFFLITLIHDKPTGDWLSLFRKPFNSSGNLPLFFKNYIADF